MKKVAHFSLIDNGGIKHMISLFIGLSKMEKCIVLCI